ncbi:MAG TPA: epimerase [Deltaproteobacteria bacterium]|nr:MAG: hypothetical protein A2Z79_11455 [Deltaproteobacteria bacterium GWA2_55_82]OGQ63575.1 MAG: hypothetical protein A3I81_05640 [Deltaproteobacteria bacterium RIFCSPLOWO2_02_FULL_55_12]OIJ75172.1 MAG: hypothetical protein A2V21_311695 [Deltaproteobacteria bacterium GWC2_55_46]HBG47482.1 epimerase [Deltaproteobacteria bacterium]HCY11498.1 epimerase [Deltaproteobacteria bacterium]
MKWLITGGCGFIGSSLVARLLETGGASAIRVLDNISTGTMEALDEARGALDAATVEFVKADVGDPDACRESAKGMDIVVHLAASTGVPRSVDDPRKDMESNVVGTFNMLEAAREMGAGAFVFASSSAPLGAQDPPMHEERACRPMSPYGAGKLAGEGYCSAFFWAYGLKTVSLRFGNVYGPRSAHKTSVVARFFRQALTGEEIVIYGDGEHTRDFIYVDDLVSAVVLSAGSGAGGELFQIATSRETSINEIAFKVRGIVESGTGMRVGLRHERGLQGEMKRNYSDISKARRLLGFSPQVDIDDGLRRTFEYFKRHELR